MKFLIHFIHAVPALFLAMIAAASLADQAIVIKFSHVVAPDTPKGQAAEYFKKIAEQRTQGRVRVEVYPDSQLYSDQVELAALELGNVQMLAPSLSKLSSLGFREFEVFDLPFLFQDYGQVHRVTEGQIGQAMLRKLDQKGVVGLAFWDNGFKQMSANRPLRSPSDMRGLRMRIQSSRVIGAQMRALGVLPQPIPFSDVRHALKSGVVDGTENPLSNFYTQNVHQVQSHLTLSNHGYLGYVVMVNKKFWDGLPGDLRDALSASVADATRFANGIAKRKNDEALAAVAQSGKTEIIELSPGQRLEWARALLPVHREQAMLIGKDLLQSVYWETGFDPARYVQGKMTSGSFEDSLYAAGYFMKWRWQGFFSALRI